MPSICPSQLCENSRFLLAVLPSNNFNGPHTRSFTGIRVRRSRSSRRRQPTRAMFRQSLLEEKSDTALQDLDTLIAGQTPFPAVLRLQRSPAIDQINRAFVFVFFCLRCHTNQRGASRDGCRENSSSSAVCEALWEARNTTQVAAVACDC